MQPRDKYARLLAYVWTTQPTMDPPSESDLRSSLFNSVLLLEGYAQVMTIPPNVKYADQFMRFQREAREQGKGLWGRLAGGEQGVDSSAREVIVYVADTGTKYHRDECRFLARSKIPLKLSEAKVQGYTPCSVCDILNPILGLGVLNNSNMMKSFREKLRIYS